MKWPQFMSRIFVSVFHCSEPKTEQCGQSASYRSLKILLISTFRWHLQRFLLVKNLHCSYTVLAHHWQFWEELLQKRLARLKYAVNLYMYMYVLWEWWIRYKLFVHEWLTSAGTRLKFVSDRMEYLILRVHWSDISSDCWRSNTIKLMIMMGSFYKELQCYIYSLNTTWKFC
jgi:hypothetical protein